MLHLPVLSRVNFVHLFLSPQFLSGPPFLLSQVSGNRRYPIDGATDHDYGLYRRYYMVSTFNCVIIIYLFGPSIYDGIMPHGGPIWLPRILCPGASLQSGDTLIIQTSYAVAAVLGWLGAERQLPPGHK